MSAKQDEIVELLNLTGVSERWLAGRLGVNHQSFYTQLKKNKDMQYELYQSAKDILKTLPIKNATTGEISIQGNTGNTAVGNSNIFSNDNRLIEQQQKEIEILKKEIELLREMIQTKNELIESLRKK
jgi:hypothetical protein